MRSAARRRAGAGSVQRGWARRSEHLRADPRRRGVGREVRPYDVAPEDFGLPRVDPEAVPAARPEQNAPSTRASSRARRARRATSPCSTPAPRSTPPGAPTTSRTGVGPPRRPWTRAPRRTCSSASSRDPRAGRRERLERDRRSRRARTSSAAAGGSPLADLERASTPAGRPPVLRGARPPRASRRSPSTSARSPSAGAFRQGATSASRRRLRAGGAAAISVLTEARALRRLARRPPRGQAASPSCRCCAGLHRRPLPGRTSPRRRRRRDPAHRRGARAARPRELHARPLGLDLDVLVEVHDEDELERALDVDADVLGIRTAISTSSRVDIDRTYDLLSDVPAGKLVVVRVGLPHLASSSTISSASASTPCSIGESLMRATDVEAACRALVGGAPSDDFEPAGCLARLQWAALTLWGRVRPRACGCDPVRRRRCSAAVAAVTCPDLIGNVERETSGA